jgi:hypothetical protein
MTFKEKNKYIQKMKNNDIRAAELIHNCPIGYGVCGLCRNMVGEEDDLK